MSIIILLCNKSKAKNIKHVWLMAQMDVLHMHFISLYFHIIHIENNNYNALLRQ
jgi:hypothetical protein